MKQKMNLVVYLFVHSFMQIEPDLFKKYYRILVYFLPSSAIIVNIDENNKHGL